MFEYRWTFKQKKMISIKEASKLKILFYKIQLYVYKIRLFHFPLRWYFSLILFENIVVL